MRRGDILAILTRGRIIVLDGVVTHPAAAFYIQGASQLARFAAAKAETKRHCAFRPFRVGASYEFLPLAAQSH